MSLWIVKTWSYAYVIVTEDNPRAEREIAHSVKNCNDMYKLPPKLFFNKSMEYWKVKQKRQIFCSTFKHRKSTTKSIIVPNIDNENTALKVQLKIMWRWFFYKSFQRREKEIFIVSTKRYGTIYANIIKF